MGRFAVVLAYNTENTIPAVGAQRQTLNCAFAEAEQFNTVGNRHVMVDFSTERDIPGKKKVLFLIFGRDVLEDDGLKAFVKSYFAAPYRWAVYGDFFDEANVDDDNLCRCNLEEDEIKVTIMRDLDSGWTLLSDRVFSDALPVAVPIGETLRSPYIVTNIDRTDQVAAIAATPILATSSGWYRVSYVLETTIEDAGAETVLLSVIGEGGTGGVETSELVALSAVDSKASGEIIVCNTTGNIEFSTAVDTIAGAKYRLRLIVERIK